MAYQVTHRTEYRYPAPVSASFGEVVMMPRDLPGQRCLRRSLTIEPRPRDLRERLDFFGNPTTYFAVLADHTRLSVTATSLVRVSGRGLAESDRPTGPRWEQARQQLRAGDIGDTRAKAGPPTGAPTGAKASTRADADAGALDARQFVLDSPRVAASARLVEYAAESFRPGRPLLDSAVDLSSRIHQDFEFRPGATAVTTTIDEVLDRRAGVCQDFAHVAIGCLRSLGLAARYVSGYLETIPPPGKERLVGADVSHAWVSLYVPGTGWVDVDPTNDQLINDRYVTTAWGRDYSDVAPLKGVIYTDGEGHEMHVSVDVKPVEAPDPH
ncbi:MAG TPA: transglutaminase family protein [Pseudonocardia sp.]|jgi:transglutaminase-like putative cysteine protease